MSRDNYYFILELDPAVDDNKTIAEKIQAKQIEWSMLSSRSGRKARAAQKYLSDLDNIKRVMSDPQLRKREAEDAAQKKQSELSEANKRLNQAIYILELRGYVFESDVKDLAKKFNFPEEEVRKKISVEIRRDQTPNKGVDISADINKIKDLLGGKTLYDFIGMFPNDSMLSLYACCSEVYNKCRSKNDADGTTLAGIGLKLFKNGNEALKEAYDDYIRFGDVYEQIDLLDSSIIPAITVKVFVDLFVKCGLSPKAALDKFVQYCEQKRYTYVLPVLKEEDYILCGHCNFRLDVATERCTNCGEPLKIQCPECRTINFSMNKVCQQCSYNFDDMRRAISLKGRAQKNIEDCKLDEAANDLEKAAELWPNNPDIYNVKQKLRNVKADISNRVNVIKEKISNKEFMAAQRNLSSLEQRYPKYRNIRLESEISNNLNLAESWMTKARNATNENEKLRCCLTALELCRDFEKALAFVKAHPPEPPQGLQTETTPEGVILRWSKSPAFGNVSYIIVRKEDAIPKSIQDGTYLIKTDNLFFEDKGIKSAAPTYYSVFAVRGGTASRPLSTRTPVSVYREVSNLNYIPGDNGVSISWRIDQKAKEVEIWRKESAVPSRRGDGTKLSSSSRTGFEDTKLRVNQRYGYRIISVYETVNRKVYTKGVEFECVTMSLPDPVRKCTVSRDASGKYLLKWEPVAKGSVQLFYSLKPVAIPDKVMSVSKVEALLKQLTVSEKGPNYCKFDIPAEISYVYPVTVYSSVGVFGEEVRIAALKDVEKVTYNVSGKKLTINFAWPVNAKELLVLYKPRQYPTGVSDKSANRRVIRRPDTSFEVNNIEKEDYYFSIYANYGDREPLYSAGKRLTVSNAPVRVVSYSIKADKTLLGKPGWHRNNLGSRLHNGGISGNMCCEESKFSATKYQ
jgi:hypothetical protein